MRRRILTSIADHDCVVEFIVEQLDGPEGAEFKADEDHGVPDTKGAASSSIAETSRVQVTASTLDHRPSTVPLSGPAGAD